MKVLFADDKMTWHILIEKVLKPRGYEIVHARSVKDVISKVEEKKPDVAILDVSLSGGSAYDVIRDVVSAGVPVVLIGLKSEGFDEGKAKSLGVSVALKKPFTVDELVKALNEALLSKPTLSAEAPKVQEEEKTPVELEPEPAAIAEAEPAPITLEEEETALPEEISLQPEAEVTEIQPTELQPTETLPTETLPPAETLQALPETQEQEELVTLEPQPQEITPIEPEVSEPPAEEIVAPSQEISTVEPKAEAELTPVPEVEPTAPAPTASEIKEEKVEHVKEEKTTAAQPLAQKKTPPSVAVSPEQITPALEQAIKEAVWEILPDLAEKILREEIEKFIKERLA